MREENRIEGTPIGNAGDHAAIAAHKTKERAYWLDRLSGDWQKSTFPYDFPGNTFPGQNRAREEILLSPPAMENVLALCNNSDSLLLVILTSMVAILLERYSGNEDIVVGLPIYRQATEDDIINTVIPCRSAIKSDADFKKILLGIRETIKEGMNHYGYPLGLLAEALGLEAGNGSSPFFDVAVLLESIQEKDYLSRQTPNMTFVFKKNEHPVEGYLEYNPDLWRKRTIQDIIKHLDHLAEIAAGHPDKRLEELGIVDDAERHRLLCQYNDPNLQHSERVTIHSTFEETADLYPDAIALVFHDVHFTYHTLSEVSGNMAGWMRARGIQTGSIVAVLLPRQPEMVVALLGALKAGAVYLPIDPGYPAERIAYMLKDSSASLLVSDSRQAESLAGTDGLTNIEVIDIETILDELDKTPRDIGEKTDHLTDSAYVIYTSGSTGKPKGVLVGHRGVVALVKNTNFIQFKSGERLLLTGAVGFDITTFEIWGPLLNGLELHLASENEILDTGKCADLVLRHRVTILHLIPQLYYQMAAVRIDAFRRLEYFLVGGDMVKAEHVNKLVHAWPELRVLHMYGPTENTTFSTFLPVDRPYESRLPIGTPLANSTVHILDRDLNLLPIGAVGEISTGGRGVAEGYLNRPELTHEKFPNDPFFPGGRLYRTGDLGRWNADGILEFWGRKDKQIKIRGFRVELSEIESKLLEYPGIAEAVVTATKGTDDGDTRLCAYFVGEPGLDIQKLRAFMNAEMPSYMVPGFFVPMLSMPLTPNGKLDTRALPAPDIMGSDAEFIPPETELECILAEIWKEVLGVEKIGVLDNFFTIGGNSLKAIQLSARIHETLGREVPVFVLFEQYTIRLFIAYLELEANLPAEEEKEQVTEESINRGRSARVKQRQLRRMEEDDE